MKTLNPQKIVKKYKKPLNNAKKYKNICSCHTQKSRRFLFIKDLRQIKTWFELENFEKVKKGIKPCSHCHIYIFFKIF